MARDISGQVKELLFRHDCVIIPGFGAFIGNYFPARIDRKEGLFEPPSRKITFNRHLTGNDGLLIGHISSVTGVGYGEARDIVNEWSAELRSRIMSDHPVTIDHLGTFSLNYDRAIVFEPDLTVNYLLTSYGLSAYHRKPVSGFDVRKMALEKRSAPAVSEPSIRSLLFRAAVIIPVLVALALVPFNDRIFKSNIEESNLNPLASAELEYNRQQIDAERSGTTVEISVPDSGASEAEPGVRPAATPEKTRATESKPVARPAATESKPAADNSTPVTSVKRSTAVVVEQYRFMVIIGSFQGEDNALTMVEKLRRLGYDPEVTGGPDGFLRVSAQSYPTLDDAKVVLEKLRKEYPGAWVHKSR
ncbi:MAG: SPOR domain-containing protein [Bacteroidetes bacterium]|nr:MAG: SPOR domain-containing protein [Bacteroidota bacterium]